MSLSASFGPATGPMSCPNIVARNELSACSRWLINSRLARFCSKWLASNAATMAPSGTVNFITTSSQNWTSRRVLTSVRLSSASLFAIAVHDHWQLMLAVAEPFSAAIFGVVPFGHFTV